MSKQPKSLNQKNAEKICETLRLQSVQGFKEMAKILANRERTTNNADCLSKLKQLMVSHPQLAHQLNEYLEEPVRFPVHKSFPEKLQQFFSYVKSRNLAHINIIIQTLKKFDKETQSNESIQTKESEDRLIEKFLELFQDDEEAYNKAKLIFEHQQPQEKPAPEPVKNRGDVDYFAKNYREARRDPTARVPNTRVIVQPPKVIPQAPKYPPDDMEFILKFQKTWSPQKFVSVTKVIFLFQHCVISMNQALDLIPQDIFESSSDYQIFKQMIETRQGSRRRTSNPFKPLNDTDFSNSIRMTFSYVQMPWCYPILCKGKTKELRAILNDKWVSVPHGSQHSNFYIRTKNQFEELLLKSEDQRYEFDLYSYRLKMCQRLLDKIIAKGDITQQEIDKVLHHIVGMNIIQTIYKNTTKQQKQELQKQLKTNLFVTCNVIKQRMTNQISALKTIRQVHGTKAWQEVAEKNFTKSLDRKCFQFKRNERDNTKHQFFEAEIEDKMKCIRKKQRSSNIFQDPVSMFSILNSFQSYSKTERCLSHNIKKQDIPTYNIEQCPSKQLLPALMFLFENKQVTTLLYTFFIYYINNCIPNDGERNKNKKIGSKFFEKILKFNYSTISLPDNFREDEFLDVLTKFNNNTSFNYPDTLIVNEQNGAKLYDEQRYMDRLTEERKQIKVKDFLEGDCAYLPLKDENSTILYFSLNMYVVIRLIYTIYERLLKAYQILYKYSQTGCFTDVRGAYKVNLFKILFMLHVKSKQNSKFQDQLADLFGFQSYMFSTIYRLFQTLVKSFQSVISDPFSCRLLDIITIEPNPSVTNNETLYYIFANRLTISHINSDNIFRINMNNKTSLITVNCFKSAYKSWDDGKDRKLQEKIQDIQKSVEFYVTQPMIDNDPRNKGKKKEKKVSLCQGNNMEYFCMSTGLKLYSRVESQDYYVAPLRRGDSSKNYKKELKRAQTTNQILEKMMVEGAQKQ